MAKPNTDLPPPLEDGDFYLENGFMVFTREYHLKRGYCCKSGCRHCPWGYRLERKSKSEMRAEARAAAAAESS